MRLFGLMIVRDAADVLTVNLTHHLAQGVERFLVLDHASVDDTPAILEHFAARGELQWRRVQGPFLAGRWLNDLAREAYLQGADWVLPVDSDELWSAGERRIVDVLRGTDAAALEVDVVNFIQQRDQLDSVPGALLRMTLRVAEPVPYALDGLERVQAGTLPFVALAYPPKWISRAAAGLRLARGNHAVSGLDGRLERSGELVCLHAPLRSRRALELRRDPESILDPALQPGESWHLERWVAMPDREVPAEWAANSALGGRLGDASIELVVDHRLGDAVRPWLENAPASPLPPAARREPGPGPLRPGLGEAPLVAARARAVVEDLAAEVAAGRERDRRHERELVRLRTELDRVRAEAAGREAEVSHRLEVLEAVRSSRFFRLWMATIRWRRALKLRRREPRRSRPVPATEVPGQLQEQGFAAPVRVFDAAEAAGLLASLRSDPPRPREWAKDTAVTSRRMYEIATDERIVAPVAAVLGQPVVLWGASLAERPVGARHPWHSDIETAAAEGTVSVWIGLEGTSQASALALVPRSHRFGACVQQVAAENGKRRAEITKEDVSAWARRRDRRSGVVQPELSDGEAIFFDGRLWHGSHNGHSAPRTALLLQYARATTPIRRPNLETLEWPVELLGEPYPPCLAIRGEPPSPSPNRIVAPPPPRAVDGLAPLAAQVRPLDLPLPGDPATGWKPHPLFRGPTPNVTLMGCHVSVLEPRSCPHPPHRHPEEEILIVLDGEAELVVPDVAGEERIHRVERGDLAYYPAGQLHTLRTPPGSRATYLMFKWTGGERDGGEAMETSILRGAGGTGDGSSGQGFEARLLFDAPTRWLRRLHCHVSTVAPGAGYEPHLDDHDVALVLLEGTIETAGAELSDTGVVYLPAGVLHGMHNPGVRTARYLVFELHGNAPHRL